MGAGVPWPVRPKSQMQRSAMAKPRMDGMAKSQRQVGVVVSVRKPSQGGRSQNQRAKKAAPTARDASVVTAVVKWDEGCGT